jgi:hypothetical protein
MYLLNSLREITFDRWEKVSERKIPLEFPPDFAKTVHGTAIGSNRRPLQWSELVRFEIRIRIKYWTSQQNRQRVLCALLLFAWYYHLYAVSLSFHFGVKDKAVKI